MSDPFALVTGTTGFIAARLVPALLADGFRVRATGRRPRPDDLPDEVEYQPADLVADDLGPLCAGVTHVFHLAGASSSKSSQEEMERDNIDATARLLDAAGARGGLERFLHMSSTSIYGEEKQLP
ncbi:MAG TPA: NAD-dependent epimerase/dehydratase family protein, partial [Acidimicrobiales bacterium]|nr:NAD-dependent epimerase/dehydratase family protein [Acidimicrobiales bacterium]